MKLVMPALLHHLTELMEVDFAVSVLVIILDVLLNGLNAGHIIHLDFTRSQYLNDFTRVNFS